MSRLISTRQWTANQRNALRSTGPKTASGRARVSQNARVHGLSRPVTVDEIEVRAVSEALALELGSQDAVDLARVIVAFERAENHLAEILSGDAPVESRTYDTRNELTLTDDILELLPQYFSPSEIEELSASFVQRDVQHSRDPIDAMQRSRRYWKRAANQLVKQARAVSSLSHT